ncbi:ComF family protein [Candidatus Roizmanbacteria bacterium]|nr:ComF family protein [Candidatus Roizmanbacteria bacterium]
MSFVDLFFPKFCVGCSLPGTYFCPRCRNDLWTVDHPICFYCKKASLNGLTHPICLNKFNIDGVASIFHYNRILKKVIKNIKYRLATETGREFFKAIKPETIRNLAFYNKLANPIYFQPIPLTEKKIRERGFNQALFLTKFFQKFVKLPLVDFLIRVKETKNQAELKTKKERYQNLRGAFKINPRSQIDLIPKSRIILVDDVVTSGSTVREAAKTLKKAGAEKVYVLALAKG